MHAQIGSRARTSSGISVAATSCQGWHPEGIEVLERHNYTLDEADGQRRRSNRAPSSSELLQPHSSTPGLEGRHLINGLVLCCMISRRSIGVKIATMTRPSQDPSAPLFFECRGLPVAEAQVHPSPTSHLGTAPLEVRLMIIALLDGCERGWPASACDQPILQGAAPRGWPRRVSRTI